MGLQYIKRQAQPIATVRRGVQAAFLALNAWIGVQFYLWVGYFESGGATVYVPRPPGVEGWLPIASLMNLKYFLLTYSVPDVHPAGMFLLIAFVGMSVVFRKAFCSWMCPIGTLSEWLWQGGVALFGRNRALPRWADLPLRSLKYMLLALVFVIGLILGSPHDERDRRVSGLRLVGIFLGFAAVVSAFYWPLWTGMQIDYNFLRLHWWLPTWT